jgi:hypothetical protein
VYWTGDLPRITILQSSDPELGPYDFECYDDATNYSATIQAITATSGIGNVEIMVRGHEGREYGASNVLLLQLNQDGVNSSVKELKIQYDLGADGTTEVGEVSGLFRVYETLRNDIYIGTTTEDADLGVGIAFANVYITGPGPHYGSLYIHSLPAGEPPQEHEHGIDITGSLHGTLLVGSLI